MVAVKKAAAALVLLLCGASSCSAQITVPEETPSFMPIVATCGTEGAKGDANLIWESDAKLIVSQDGRTAHIWAAPGEHYLEVLCQVIDWEAKQSLLKKYTARFVVAGTVPDPVPPPPGPDPPPDPPTPVVGKFDVMILHESEDATADTSRMFINLRSGNNAKWLKDKGHKLRIIDDDTTDEQGQPLRLVSTLKGLGIKMPALFVLDSTGKVVHKQELSPGTTADNVVEILTRIGG